MSHRVLITGASGYLGGDFLARLPKFDLPPYEKLYALIRTDDQAAAVKKYGAVPLKFAVNSQEEVHDAIVRNGITIVFYLIDALKSESQVLFINALAELKNTTGKEVHFIHVSEECLCAGRSHKWFWHSQVSGAKIFSSLAGAPTDAPFLDTRSDLYDIQKKQNAPFAFMQQVCWFIKVKTGLADKG